MKRKRKPVSWAVRKKYKPGWQPRRRRVRRSTFTQESKFLDSDKDDAVIASAGAITTSINLVPQDATESGRIGRKITINKVMVSSTFFLGISQDDADIPSGDVGRMIVFIDYQANGANAAVTDLLESAEFDSFRNLSNTGRFKFLCDKTYALNRRVAMTDGTNTSATPHLTNNLLRLYFNVNVPIEFNATTGAITEIRSNNIAILYISKNGLIGVTSKVRIRYTG